MNFISRQGGHAAVIDEAIEDGTMLQPPTLTVSRRTRQTPYTPRIEALGVKAYSIYNHTLMPTSFKSLAEDYWHLKHYVQLWDVSCERQVEISGPDAARFVQYLTPRDLSKAVVGQCLYAPLVDETGGMINDPVILKLADDRFWLSLADSDVLLWAKALAFGLGLDVRVSEADVWPLAVQGPRADELMASVFGDGVREIRFFRFQSLEFQGRPLMVSRSGFSRQGGFEIYVDDLDLGLALWDTLWQAGQPLHVGPGCPNLIERIEGGLLSYGNDMTIADNPFECGLDRYCSLDADTDFIGRAALMKARRDGPRRLIRGLRMDGGDLPPCHQPWPVYAAGRKIGKVTSAAYSPELECGVGLGMLASGYWRPDTAVDVETPKGRRAARVSDLPFSHP